MTNTNEIHTLNVTVSGFPVRLTWQKGEPTGLGLYDYDVTLTATDPTMTSTERAYLLGHMMSGISPEVSATGVLHYTSASAELMDANPGVEHPIKFKIRAAEFPAHEIESGIKTAEEKIPDHAALKALIQRHEQEDKAWKQRVTEQAASKRSL